MMLADQVATNHMHAHSQCIPAGPSLYPTLGRSMERMLYCTSTHTAAGSGHF